MAFGQGRPSGVLKRRFLLGEVLRLTVRARSMLFHSTSSTLVPLDAIRCGFDGGCGALRKLMVFPFLFDFGCDFLLSTLAYFFFFCEGAGVRPSPLEVLRFGQSREKWPFSRQLKQVGPRVSGADWFCGQSR